MRSIKKYITGVLAFLVTGFFLSSCEKTFDEKMPLQDNLNNSTRVQVFVATVNANRNHIWVDGSRVTGAALASGSLFPGSTGFSVPAGLRAFLVRDTLATTTQLPLSFSENMKQGSHQTIFLYDTINSPKQKTVIDNIETIKDTSARIRFANFIYNPTIVPAIDVFSFAKNANIFTNVAVTDVTNFIPYPSRSIDTLYIRETGSTVNIIKVAIVTGNGATITDRRHYTLVYRGSHRGTRVATLYATQ